MQQLDAELEKNKNTTLVSFHDRLFSRVFSLSLPRLCFTSFFSLIISSTALPVSKRISVPSLEQRLKANAALCLAQRVCSQVMLFHFLLSLFTWLKAQDAFLSAFIPSPNNESPLGVLQQFPHLMREIFELLTPSWIREKRQDALHKQEVSERSQHTLSL